MQQQKDRGCDGPTNCKDILATYKWRGEDGGDKEEGEESVKSVDYFGHGSTSGRGQGAKERRNWEAKFQMCGLIVTNVSLVSS